MGGVVDEASLWVVVDGARAIVGSSWCIILRDCGVGGAGSGVRVGTFGWQWRWSQMEQSPLVCFSVSYQCCDVVGGKQSIGEDLGALERQLGDRVGA